MRPPKIDGEKSAALKVAEAFGAEGRRWGFRRVDNRFEATRHTEAGTEVHPLDGPPEQATEMWYALKCEAQGLAAINAVFCNLEECALVAKSEVAGYLRRIGAVGSRNPA